MNKFKKFTRCLISSLLVVSFLIVPTLAENTNEEVVNSENDYSYEVVGDNVLLDSEGNYMVFESLDQLNSFLNYNKQSRICLPGDPGYPNCPTYVPTKQTTTLHSTGYFSEKFMGYNERTPSWSKASSYNLTMTYSQSFSQSLEYGGTQFGVSITIGSGVTINMPANSSKYSKLGHLADITARKYKVVVTNANTGAYISTYYYVTPTVTNTYNSVIYQ